MKTIYAVTVFQTVNTDDISGLSTFGDRRCVGWFDNFDEAECAVLNNFENMHSNMYDYVIIEEMPSGIFAVDTKRTVYNWNGNCYVKIAIPEELKKVSNFGIG